MKTYNLVNHVFTELYGSKDEMDSIIRAGIISKYNKEPEEACKAIVDGIIVTRDGVVGFSAFQVAVGVIVILAALFFSIGYLLKPIMSYCERVKEAEWAAVDQQVALDACGSDMDYEETELYQKWINSKNSGWIPAILAGLVGLWLLLKK